MVKYLFLVAALVAGESHSSEKVSATEICASHAKLANSIMKLRQTGTEMTTALNSINNLPDDNNKRLAEAMIMMAYGEGAYSVEENQQKAITEFSNKVMLMCMTKAKAN